MDHKEKKDGSLGRDIHSLLQKLGVESPIVDYQIYDSEEQKIAVIEDKFVDIYTALGIDLTNDSTRDTPRRIAKMLVKEVNWGLDYENFPRSMDIVNCIDMDQMIVIRNATVESNCEHHSQPFEGYANVAYIPREKVLGLSKINRIVSFFSHRPSVQERLTKQIGETLKYIAQTEDVAVEITAKHGCVRCRGVQDRNSFTTTSFLSGSFKTDERTRSEFYSLISRNNFSCD